MIQESKIFGIRAIQEAINAEQQMGKIYLQKDIKSNSFKEFENYARKQGIPISYVPIEKLDGLAKGKNHQGIVASISPITFEDLDTFVETITQNKNDTPLILLLDQITDVRNFGAIIRTASCVGASGIIVPINGSAPINADTVKTSAGGVFNIPICKVAHIKDAIFHLQSYNIQILAATEKADELVYQSDMTKPTAIVLGSEGTGISPSILKLVEQKIKLPMYGDIASLNVSVAAAVFLYEAVRQRKFK